MKKRNDNKIAKSGSIRKINRSSNIQSYWKKKKRNGEGKMVRRDGVSEYLEKCLRLGQESAGRPSWTTTTWPSSPKSSQQFDQDVSKESVLRPLRVDRAHRASQQKKEKEITQLSSIIFLAISQSPFFFSRHENKIKNEANFFLKNRSLYNEEDFNRSEITPKRPFLYIYSKLLFIFIYL